jgi:homogentisate 1,2-dioxygenase
MEKKAFCNNDGDMLILPQQGRLDIQTEFGKYALKFKISWEVSQPIFDHDLHYYRLMVRSGELCVIQRGMKFKVNRLNVIFRITSYSRATGHPSRWSLPCHRISNEYLILKNLDSQEIYGSHYVLPELGPLGGNGLPTFATSKVRLHHLISTRVHGTVRWICRDQLPVCLHHDSCL